MSTKNFEDFNKLNEPVRVPIPEINKTTTEPLRSLRLNEINESSNIKVFNELFKMQAYIQPRN